MLSAKTNQRECPRHLTSPSLCSALTAFILIGIVCVFCFVLCVCVCVCVCVLQRRMKVVLTAELGRLTASGDISRMTDEEWAMRPLPS
jgi:hypothetical protein